MAQSISAEFDGKVIIPDQPLRYSPGQRLRIIVEAVQPSNDLRELPAELPPDLERREDGAIVVRGRRISLFLILDAMYRGLGAEEIQQRYPTLSGDAVDRIMKFCRQHEDSVRRFYDQQASIAREHCDPHHQGPSLEELRGRRSPQQS